VLTLPHIDLGELVAARDHRDDESSFWIDPRTGAIEFCSVDDSAEDFDERGLVPVEPIDTHESYEIMEDFVASVSSREAREKLGQAIRGRGAFGRFRDRMYDYPDLKEPWFAFRDRRMEQLALEWLAFAGLVAEEEVDAAIEALRRSAQPPLRAVLLDVDGVLTVSWTALPGAVEAFAALRASGVPLALVTSTTSRTRAAVGEALRAAGFDVADEEIVTAPVATAAYLAEHHPGARCLLLSSGDVTADLTGVMLVGPDAEQVDVVLVGGAGPELGYPALNRAFGHLLRGARLVAMHRSMFWRTDAGLALDAGAFVAALEAASGTTAEVVGKPAAGLFTAALARLGIEPAEAVMVGDDVDADVLAAQRAGLAGVLVRTGKFLPETLENADGEPDAVLDSVADLPAWLERRR
ncbi:HAD-IIA family hydrolase, partial [Georgenia ruanii]|nr:HAD-IIA family hydrolase [Georgenia ruanii]